MSREGRRLPTAWIVGACAVAAVVACVVLLFDGAGRDRDSERESEALPEPPTLQDHWHTAFGVYVCGTFLPTSDHGRDPVGIHTHGDGLVHVHPFTRSATGRNADVGLFFRSTGQGLDDDSVQWDGTRWTERRSTCGGRPGRVVVVTPAGRTTEDVAEVRLVDCSWVVVAFVADHEDVPVPPSVAALETFTDTRDPMGCGEQAALG